MSEIDLRYAQAVEQKAQVPRIRSDEDLRKYSQAFDKRFTEIAFAREEAGVLHNDMEWDRQLYQYVKRNDKENILKTFQLPDRMRYGIFSRDAMRSRKDLLICLITSITEMALEDGIIALEVVRNASDAAISLVEEIRKPEELAPQALAFLFKMGDLIEENRQNAESYLVKRAKNYVYAHFHERIQVEAIAAELGVSKEHLSRTFSASEGISLKEFIQREKVSRAKNLLVYSDRSIQEISEYLAFSTQSHFSDVFRRHTGFTPARYRREFSSASHQY